MARTVPKKGKIASSSRLATLHQNEILVTEMGRFLPMALVKSPMASTITICL